MPFLLLSRFTTPALFRISLDLFVNPFSFQINLCQLQYHCLFLCRPINICISWFAFLFRRSCCHILRSFAWGSPLSIRHLYLRVWFSSPYNYVNWFWARDNSVIKEQWYGSKRPPVEALCSRGECVCHHAPNSQQNASSGDPTPTGY